MYTQTREKIHQFTGRKLTKYQLQKVVESFYIDERTAELAAGTKTIEQIVCEIYGCNYDEVFTPDRVRRSPKIYEPHHMAAYFYYKYFNINVKSVFVLSLAQIGFILHCDHATVLNAVKQTSNLMGTDPHFRTIAQRIDTKVFYHFNNKTLKVLKP